MQTRSALALAVAAALLGVTAVLMIDGRVAAPPRADDDDVSRRLDELTRLVRDSDSNTRASLDRVRAEQQRLSDALAALEAHEIAGTPDHGHRDADSGDRSSGPPAGRGDDTASPPAESDEVSEIDLGRWMDESLQVADWSAEATALATEQAEATVAGLPDVQLADLQCGTRFCKATFADKRGRTPDIAPVFGMPPFVSEGFAIDEPDGRRTLYFTQAGETLSSLRAEAGNAAQP